MGVGKHCRKVTGAQPANHRTAPPRNRARARTTQAYRHTARKRRIDGRTPHTSKKVKPTATNGPEKAHSATEATEARLLFYVFYVFEELVNGVVRSVLPANRLTRSITVFDYAINAALVLNVLATKRYTVALGKILKNTIFMPTVFVKLLGFVDLMTDGLEPNPIRGDSQ